MPSLRDNSDFIDQMSLGDLNVISQQFHKRVQKEHDRINAMKGQILQLAKEKLARDKYVQELEYKLNGAWSVGGTQHDSIEKLEEACLKELNDPHGNGTLYVSDIAEMFDWKLEKTKKDYKHITDWKKLKLILKEYKISEEALEDITDMNGPERITGAIEWLDSQEKDDKYEIVEKQITVPHMPNNVHSQNVQKMIHEGETEPKKKKNKKKKTEEKEEVQEEVDEESKRLENLMKMLFEDGAINMAEVGMNKIYSDAVQFKLKNQGKTYEDFLNQGGKKEQEEEEEEEEEIRDPCRIENIGETWVNPHNETSTQNTKEKAVKCFKDILRLHSNIDIEKVNNTSKWEKLSATKSYKNVKSVSTDQTDANFIIKLKYSDHTQKIQFSKKLFSK